MGKFPLSRGLKSVRGVRGEANVLVDGDRANEGIKDVFGALILVDVERAIDERVGVIRELRTVERGRAREVGGRETLFLAS